MRNRESSPTNSAEMGSTAKSENPWQKMAKEAPSFGGGEVAHRDSEYFNQEEISATLKSEVVHAEQRVKRTMVKNYFGEDGFIHKVPDEGEIPSTDTEDAEIDLKNARQDVETFDLLMNDYRASSNNLTSRAIKKEDFIPIIGQFIDKRTVQINQLNAEMRTLAKDTPEYVRNEL